MRLATLLVCLFAIPAAAQAPGTYGIFATQAELDDGGTLSGAIPTCLLVGTASGTSGAFFWDATSEQFAIYDASADPGSRTTVPVPAFLIDIAAGTNVTTCRDATPELDADGVPTGVAFLVLSDANDQDFVARVDAANQGFSVLTDRNDATDSGDGISGIAQVGDVLYLARQEFNGAPEDGIYTIDTTTEDQAPTPFLLDADLDLTAVAYAPELDLAPPAEGLYLISSSFGEGNFENAILYIDPEASSPTLVVLDAPCAGAEPVFVSCDDGGLEAIAVGSTFSGDAFNRTLLVSNNAFGSPDGETVGAFVVGLPESDGLSFDGEVFTESGLVAETGIGGYTTAAPTGYLSYVDFFATAGPGAVLYLAGSEAFGGTPGIYSVTIPPPVASEAPPEDAFKLIVSPNPAVGAVRLSATSEIAGALRVSVVDALGRTVAVLYEGEVAGGTTLELQAPELAPGVYTVRVEGAAGVRAERLTVVR